MKIYYSFNEYFIIVIAWGQGFVAVNQPESEGKGGLRCHKSLATVLPVHDLGAHAETRRIQLTSKRFSCEVDVSHGDSISLRSFKGVMSNGCNGAREAHALRQNVQPMRWDISSSSSSSYI